MTFNEAEGRDTCTATKGGDRCIKFPGHPGRCRFLRRYTRPVGRIDKPEPKISESESRALWGDR